ncbi:oligosaccharide repeat unit polymerase [Nostoc sp. PA-18-2419]|uniref:oligosaccharide repeat unit polymerase n=1 Tax=Nostoc sp. PA-18-2419 TaxID=2575443 RepID=UPI001108A4A3|nr:oligosaccharide repeat unit polymerase [Nostoc sp. PA-18-2419]
MPLFEFPDLAFIQIGLIVFSGIWMLWRNDELPLLIGGFLFYISSYRYWAVTSGFGKWVSLGKLGGFNSITTEAALIALNYMVLGEICLIGAYMFCQKQFLPVIKPISDRPFLQWLSPKVINFGLICLPIVLYIRAQVGAQLAAGQSLAFDVSGYLYLFPMVLVGIATLILCVWKFGGFSSIRTKIMAFSILVGVSYYTFSPNSRFQFLGWMLASAIVLSSSYRPKTRLIIFTIIAILAISIFAVAGAMRNTTLAEDAVNQAALERAFSAEDANMLDGFVMIQQVYPERLDFSWGMEHLEILMRPIPRALWPEKPVGGYMNKLNITINQSKGTLGISPSLLGSFYAEGGIIGIIFFSIVYGKIFASIVRYTTRIHPFASILVRAILCACLIPLLRGGDLPGIYAWFGMAFWPCFLLLWIKQKYFRPSYLLTRHFYLNNSV